MMFPDLLKKPQELIIGAKNEFKLYYGVNLSVKLCQMDLFLLTVQIVRYVVPAN